MSGQSAGASRQAYARLAGFATLFYILVGSASVFLYSGGTNAEGVAGTLAGVAAHALAMRTTVLLELLECFSALVLAISLYSITRDQGQELAMLGMVCRVAEGVLGAIGIPRTLGLLWLAQGGASDAATTSVLGTFLLMPSQGAMIGAPFFAVGSLLFAYLLLRGRLIPVPLAWLGILSSALLVVGVPLQLAGFLGASATMYLWLPMVAFEIPLGLWLLIKAVPQPKARGAD
jgi:hypothetical protein